MICSVLLWVMVALFTQCLDPPSWGEERASWEVVKHVETELARNAFRLKKSFQHPLVETTLPAAHTDSMKDDELDFFTPSNLSDDSMSSVVKQPIGYNVVVTSTPTVSSPSQKLISKSTPTEQSEKPWIPDFPAQSHGDVRSSAKAYPTVDPPAKQSESPWKADFPAQPRGDVRSVSQAPLSAGYPESSAGTNAESQRMNLLIQSAPMQAEQDAPSTSMILEDLMAVEPDDEVQFVDEVARKSVQKESEDKYLLGIRALTRTLNLHSKPRLLGRGARRGYEKMFDGDGYDSDAEPMSPPIIVEIKPFAQFDDFDFDGTDDENDKANLMNDWNALHQANMPASIQGEYSSRDEWIDFSAPVQNYYSDPEPTLDSSEEEEEEEEEEESHSFKRGAPSSSRQGGDASTISGLSGSQTRSLDGKKSRRKARRKRGPDPPARSIKSSGESLLDLTIDEETDQDVMGEISDDDAKGILGAYRLTRTMSEPNYVYNQRRNLTGVQSYLDTIPIDQRHGSSLLQHRQESHSMPDSNSSVVRRPAAEPTQSVLNTANVSSGHSVGQLSVIDPPSVGPSYASSTPKPAVDVIDRYQQTKTKSLSPPRHRPIVAETLSLEGIHSKRSSAMMESIPSIRSSTDVGVSDILRQAREHRIRRMQHENKDKAENIMHRVSYRSRIPVEPLTDSTSIRKQQLRTTEDVESRNQGMTFSQSKLSAHASRWLQDNPRLTTENSSSDGIARNEERRVDLSFTPGHSTAFTGFSKDGDLSLSPISKGSEDMTFTKTTTIDKDSEDFPTMTTYEASEFLPLDESTVPVTTTTASEMKMMTSSHSNGSSSSEEQRFSAEDFERYGRLDIDDLDLQLIAVRRPLGQEYGDDESSI